MRKLFFLPGTGASPDFWKPVGARLPSHWSKHYFGWPGLGDQPPDPAINSYDDLLRLVEARLDGPVDLIAQSIVGLPYDARRTLRLVAFGVFMDGPIGKKREKRCLGLSNRQKKPVSRARQAPLNCVSGKLDR